MQVEYLRGGYYNIARDAPHITVNTYGNRMPNIKFLLSREDVQDDSRIAMHFTGPDRCEIYANIAYRNTYYFTTVIGPISYKYWQVNKSNFITGGTINTIMAEPTSSGCKFTFNNSTATIGTSGSNSCSATQINICGYRLDYNIHGIEVWFSDGHRYKFVPCYRKNDMQTGFYDVLGRRFYPNVGTNDFIIGPDKPEKTIDW